MEDMDCGRRSDPTDTDQIPELDDELTSVNDRSEQPHSEVQPTPAEIPTVRGHPWP